MMFRLIHSCNYETSDFVKDELPGIINARGKCPPFSMPFAIPKDDEKRNHCLVKIANSGGESVMAEVRDLSMKHFGMSISKYDRLPKKLNTIIVRASYFQEIIKMNLKSYLIVSKDILPDTLQKKQDGGVSMEDLEKFFHRSDNGPMFCKHLYNYATTALVSGLSFNDAVRHLKEAWDAVAVSMQHYPGLTPPEKTVVLGKKVHSPHITSFYPVVARELASHGLKERTEEERESNGSLPIVKISQEDHAIDNSKRTTGNELESVSHFSSVCISCLMIHSLMVFKVFSTRCSE